MKRLISLVAVTGLALAGMGIIGCESNDTAPRPGHTAQFGGGNGAFGTTPETAGDYSSDLPHHQAATQPATQPSRGER